MCFFHIGFGLPVLTGFGTPAELQRASTEANAIRTGLDNLSNRVSNASLRGVLNGLRGKINYSKLIYHAYSLQPLSKTLCQNSRPCNGGWLERLQPSLGRQATSREVYPKRERSWCRKNGCIQYAVRRSSVGHRQKDDSNSTS